MTILGLHHISIVTRDAQRMVDFYTQALGLRLVKQTVNFDAPNSYHLYFGDTAARPGTLITYFEWPGAAAGAPGLGGTHHYALRVADTTAQLKWKRRLTDLHLKVTGPFDRHYFTSIYFTDPDGTIIEIATDGPGWTRDEAPGAVGQEFRAPPAEMLVNNRDEARIAGLTWPEPVPTITPDMALNSGMHHITAIGRDIGRTHAFFGDLLGMQRVKMTSNFDDPKSAHWYWGVDGGRPGTLITYFERNPATERPARLATPSSMLRHAIHFARGATPIWLPAWSSPMPVPRTCVPCPKSSHGTGEVKPHGLVPLPLASACTASHQL